MMAEDGFDVSVYDKHFHPDRAVLGHTYDFIVCTETAEHFDNPARDFREMDGLLKPGGWLGVMTAMLDDWANFPEWYYHRDHNPHSLLQQAHHAMDRRHARLEAQFLEGKRSAVP